MDLKDIVESILFSAQKPLSSKEIKDVLAGACEHSEEASVRQLKRARPALIDEALETLEREHDQAGRSFRLACVAGAWQFVSKPEFAPWLKALVGHRARAPRLSQPALETLAIIAYRQPLTRAEIERVRGVAVDGVMATLLERGLVEQVGRAELPGRPITYGTTASFLEYFGLKNLEALPAADELRRIPVEKPAGLLTVDPVLETAPDEVSAPGAQPGQDDADTLDSQRGSEGPAPRSARQDERAEEELEEEEEEEEPDGGEFEEEDEELEDEDNDEDEDAFGDEDDIDDEEEIGEEEEEEEDDDTFEDEEDLEEESNRGDSDGPKVSHSAAAETVSASQTGEEEKRG